MSQHCDRCDVPFTTDENYYLRPRIDFCESCQQKNKDVMMILFEGTFITVDPKQTIQPGDTYLAKRNTGWKLLTCRRNEGDKGIVVPIENAYSYNTDECLKVVEIGEAQLVR